MMTRLRLPLIASAILLAVPAALQAQDVSDYRLPEPGSTPTPSPRVQGPVDTESGNLPVRPRDLSTPRPTPTPSPTVRATQPAETGTAPRSTATISPGTASRPTPQRSEAAVPRIGREPQPLPTSAPRTPIAPIETPVPGSDSALPTTPSPTLPAATPAVGGAASPATTTTEGEKDTGGFDWTWLAGALTLLLALGGAFLWWRRRSVAAPPPQIERPVVVPTASQTGSDRAVAGAVDLKISAEAIKLTRSVAYATLQYRLTIINRSTTALSGAELGADIASAHGGVPMEDQVATAANRLEKRHTFPRIAPGQTVRYEGTLQMPLSQARIIRQGSAALLVPLLRVRIDLGERQGEPLLKTFVIGQGVPDGGRVTPFRVDEGPRSYSPIAARPLD